MYGFWRKPGTMRWAVFAFTSYSVVARCHLLWKYYNFQKEPFEAKELYFILFSKKLHWMHTLKWQCEIWLPFSIGLSPKVPVFKSRSLYFLTSSDHSIHQSISTPLASQHLVWKTVTCSIWKMIKSELIRALHLNTNLCIEWFLKIKGKTGAETRAIQN